MRDGLDASPDRIVKPPLEVLRELDVPAIGDDSPVRIPSGLAQLGPCLFLCLIGDVAALSVRPEVRAAVARDLPSLIPARRDVPVAVRPLGHRASLRYVVASPIAPSSFRIFVSIRAAVLSRPTRRALSTSSRHAASAASGVPCSPRCTSTLNTDRRDPGLPVIS